MGAQRVAGGIRRAISATTLVLYLAGCTGWYNMGTIAAAPVPRGPQFLRVTLKSGNQLELRYARIVGDSVVGQTGPWPYRERTSVALSVVTQIDNRQVSGGATAGLLAVVILLGTLMVGEATGPLWGN